MEDNAINASMERADATFSVGSIAVWAEIVLSIAATLCLNSSSDDIRGRDQSHKERTHDPMLLFGLWVPCKEHAFVSLFCGECRILS